MVWGGQTRPPHFVFERGSERSTEKAGPAVVPPKKGTTSASASSWTPSTRRTRRLGSYRAPSTATRGKRRLESPANRQSRRPDSNRGPLHYETTTSKERPSMRGHAWARNPWKATYSSPADADAGAHRCPPSCTRFVPRVSTWRACAGCIDVVATQRSRPRRAPRSRSTSQRRARSSARTRQRSTSWLSWPYWVSSSGNSSRRSLLEGGNDSGDLLLERCQHLRGAAVTPKPIGPRSAHGRRQNEFVEQLS
jgi:hypothetical protein